MFVTVVTVEEGRLHIGLRREGFVLGGGWESNSGLPITRQLLSAISPPIKIITIIKK
jgi:hypothetical protein